MNKIYFHSPNKKVFFLKYKNLLHSRKKMSEGDVFGDSKFRKILLDSKRIVFNFSFKKIGDTLLTLIGYLAIIDFLKICNIETELIYCGKNTDLMSKLNIFTKFEKLRNIHLTKESFILSDNSSISSHIFLAPEKIPIFKDKNLFYYTLPQRYYIHIENLLKVKLLDIHKKEKRFIFNNSLLTIDNKYYNLGIISSTSLKDRKNYPYFFDLLITISKYVLKPIRCYWFNGGTSTKITITKESYFQQEIFFIKNGRLKENAQIFSQLNLIIGNDTGLTHLAALSQSIEKNMPNVISLYNRHSFYKWNTGYQNHHCISTLFPYIIGINDLCPVRDKLDERKWYLLSNFKYIAPKDICDYCLKKGFLNDKNTSIS